MTRDRTAVTCEACVAEAPCWHCDGEGRKYHWDGLGKSEWRDCADCAGSGEASQDPFDPINRRAWDSGMEAYAARDDRVSESEAPEPIDPGACVDCGERAYTERDGAPLGAARCWDCGSREANED
jgi:hypothetical protein